MISFKNQSITNPAEKKNFERRLTKEIVKIEIDNRKSLAGNSFLDSQDREILNNFDNRYINNPVGTYKSPKKKRNLEGASKSRSP